MITTTQTRPSLPTAHEPAFFLPPDVIFLTVHDGSARLLDMAGQFHAVPAVGTLMLQESLAHGAEEAANRVAQEYGVEPGQVQNDLEIFLHELQKQGLLCSQRNRRRWGRPTTGLARLVLQPALACIYRAFRSRESKARALLGLARISFGLFGWTRTIAVWQEAHARFPSWQAAQTDEQTARAADQAVRAAAASHPFETECKERALCCWALARSVGLDAALVVGINLFPLAGHCWCEVGSWTLSDDEDRCVAYTPVGRWGGKMGEKGARS
jgi:hypothetical protein